MREAYWTGAVGDFHSCAHTLLLPNYNCQAAHEGLEY